MFAPPSKLRSRRNLSQRVRPRARLWLAALEERDVPATFTVTVPGDNGNFNDLRSCIAQANANPGADFIDFDASVFTAQSTITLDSLLGALSITQDVSIDASGIGGIVISGDNAIRVFVVDGNSDAVAFTQLTIQDGRTSDDGAGVYSPDAHLVFDHCMLQGNTAEGNGGGLFVRALASFTDCVVSNNLALGNGGGIYLNGEGPLDLVRTSVTSNEARQNGGGLALPFGGWLTISDTSTISENHADGFGGGIYDLNGGAFSLTGQSAVSGNSAGNDGGGIYLTVPVANISNCEFLNNTAEGDGGALYLSGCQMTITESTMRSNTASHDGGAIVAFQGNIQIGDSTIDMNTSSHSGGAVYSQTTTFISGSKFQGNDAQFGGALEIATPSASLELTQCYVLHFPGLAEEGAGVRLRNVSTTEKSIIQDVYFTEDYVQYRGGGLAVVGSGAVEVLGTGDPINKASFESGGAYQAGGMGGAIYISALNDQSPTVHISGYNIGGHGGGIKDGNYAEYGGNIAIVDVSTVITIENCDINLGGVHTGFVPTSIIGANIYVTGNGGGSVILNNNKIRDGKAFSGAGIGVTDSNIALAVDQCQIVSNLGLDSGGGVFLSKATGKMTFDRSTIDGNTAANSGGGMLIDSLPEITIKDSTISNNIASSGFGGGIYEVFQAHGHATITQCTIYGNQAVRGGGIYGQGADSASLIISNSTIASNTASGGDPSSINTESQGGGIWFDDYDNFELKSTIVATNLATAILDAGGPDIHSGGPLTAHYSLIGVDDGFTPDSPASINFDNNQVGTVGTPLDPVFVPFGGTGQLLGPNGGPTYTIAIDENSPAYNKGRNFLDLSYDQRGASFWRVVGDAPDIGAYEYEPDGWQSAQVSEVRLNADIAQPTGCENSHSRILNVRITFSMGVTLPSQSAIESAFQIERSSDGAHPPFTATVTTSGNATVVTLTFDDSGNAIEHHSLADGRYSLKVFADKISAGNFDGNGNGTPQGSPTDDYVLAAPTGSAPFTVPSGGNLAGANISFFRYYGDATGDGLVGLNDFALFRSVFNLGTGPGNGNTVFDFDDDLNVGLSDFAAFRGHFNLAV